MLKDILLEMYAEDEEERFDGLVGFFMNNPSPSDDEVHALAEEMGVEHDELEERIYSLLSSLLKDIGKHNDVPDDEFDKKELEAGIEVEMEHTDDRLVAKMIAKDHLKELPDYYTRLKEMESEAGVEHHEEDEEYYESVGSEIKRKVQGKVSGKEQARRVGVGALQRVVDGISTKNLEDMFGSPPDEEIYGYLGDLRKDAVDAIKTLKSIEK